MNVLSFNVDSEADAAHAVLSRHEVHATEEVAEGVILDLDLDGHAVGIELLDVRARVGDGDLSTYLRGLVEGLFAPRRDAAE